MKNRIEGKTSNNQSDQEGREGLEANKNAKPKNRTG
jgi:hypothetical protein